MRQSVEAPGTYELFVLNGHGIYIHFSFAILLLLIGSAGGDPISAAAFALAVTISILWHELGHATAYQVFDCGPSNIFLQGFGGMTVNVHRGELSRMRAIGVSAAGPVAGLVLAVPFLALEYFGAGLVESPVLRAFISSMAFINLIWSLFNLLPIYPMDGGHIVYRVLHGTVSSPEKVTAVLSWIAIAAILVGLSSRGFSIQWAAIILGLMAFENWQIFRGSR